MVTWVCAKESSSIQSGWREGKVNLGGTPKTRVTSSFGPGTLAGAGEAGLGAYLTRWKVVERSSSLWMAMPM